MTLNCYCPVLCSTADDDSKESKQLTNKQKQMRKVKLLRIVAAMYAVCACVFIMMCDTNMLYAILVIVCIIGCWGYADCADTREQRIMHDSNIGHD